MWYDRIAGFYDFFTFRFYRKPREELTKALQIRKQDRILVLACGTGQIFEFLRMNEKHEGEIVGVDFSEKMLEVARKRIEKNAWKRIHLIHADVRDLNKEFFQKREIQPEFDVIIGALAFSVVPGWKRLMDTAFYLLKENGRLGLLDWHASGSNPVARVIDFFAKSQMRRDIQNYASQIFPGFEVKRYYMWKMIFVATGKKTPDSVPE
jgi:demethylmenaquinone methyltransferase/2-methoxy-6-polyprenyl-1,4-benzoquinol methylase